MTDMLELYQFSERQFLEFDEIVPMRLNKNRNVVSPKLYFLLMTICGQVESLMKSTCKKLDMYNPKDNFPKRYSKLCQGQNVMKKQSVQTVTTREIIKPFAKTGNNTPPWWNSYNQVKHEVPKGLKDATMKNTIHALGGLYLLLNFYKSTHTKRPKDALDPQYWLHDITARQTGLEIPRKCGYVPDKDYSSNLFILKSHFMTSEI